MRDEKVHPDEIFSKDLFLRIFSQRLKLSSGQIILFVCVISAILFWGIGGIASMLYTGSGKRFTEPDNLLFMIAWVLIFVPLIWGAYTWQAKNAPALLAGLIQGKSFREPNLENKLSPSQRANLILQSMLSRKVYVFAFITLLIFWGLEFGISWPEQLSRRTEYWFEVHWYLPIHILTWSLSLFPLFIFAIRHLLFIIGLRNMFLETPVEVRPLDPDECGGLGEVGNFVKSSILVAIGLGFIAVFFSVLIHLNSSNILNRPDVMGLFILYAALVPFSLIVPITSARAAMLRAREKVLAPLAKEFQEVLSALEQKFPQKTAQFREINDRLKEIQIYRETILHTYPTMPILLGALQRFSLTATLPLITALVTLALQILK